MGSNRNLSPPVFSSPLLSSPRKKQKQSQQQRDLMASSCCSSSSPPLPRSIRPSLLRSFSPSSVTPSRRKTTGRILRSSMSPSPLPDEGGDGKGKGVEPPERVKLAFQKAAAYKEEKERAAATKTKQMPESVRKAMEKARQYRMKNTPQVPEPQGTQKIDSDDSRDVASKESSAKSESSDSKIDSMEFDSSDEKKRKGSPSRLAPPEDLPEVEIIDADSTKFGNAKSSQKLSSTTEDDASDLYKPKVSTWGIFPRPENISKTFGGGRTIHPGQELETAEVKAAREARTRELIARYKSEFVINIDPKSKIECDKALKNGDQLMDKGKLLEALPYYEKIMKALDFQSELHGLAALQWAICQDSLCRHDEAEVVYEKLQSHPNVSVSKKASQFVFNLQVLQMMKISNLLSSTTTGYESYFEALCGDGSGYGYAPTKEHDSEYLQQILPYILWLFSPVVLVVSLAAWKGLIFSGR